MPKGKRAHLTGRGAVGKAVVAGAKDRATNTVSAEVIGGTDYDTLQSFVASRAAPGSKVYTDQHRAYQGMPFDHETVNHSGQPSTSETKPTRRGSNRSGLP